MADNADSELAPLYMALGTTLSKWAQIERALGFWFAEVTGMPLEMAQAVFFSARNFRARSEMLEAAIAFTTLDPELLAVLKECSKKAAAYSSFRNQLAHGIPVVRADRFGRNPVLSEGSDAPMPAIEKVIRVPAISQAGTSFEALGGLLFDLLIGYRANWHHTPLSECLGRVLLLPNEPESATLSRKQQGQLRQRQSSRSK